MSEQFAIQPEEFDSTNERLDSILDRLNALGQSAAATKTATKRSLESVPGIQHDEPGDVITAPNNAEASNDIEAPNDINVAARPLGLVPPIIDDEPTESTDDALDDAFDGEAFSDLQVVDTGALFESVTVVDAAAESAIDVLDEPEAIDIEPVVLDDELPPVDLEIPEAGWTEVGNYEVAENADPASEITDEEIALEDAALEQALLEEGATEQAAEVEAVAAEVAEADLFEAQEAVEIEPETLAPVLDTDATPAVPVEETVVETPNIFAPAPAEAAEADMAGMAAATEAPPAEALTVDLPEAEVPPVEVPQAEVAEPTPIVAPANEAPTEPIEVEFHEMELTPDPVAHIDSQVFDLDETDSATAAPSGLPNSPQSIFSSSLGSGTNKSEPAVSDEADGWVSHHGPSEEPASFAQVTGDSDTEIGSTSTYEAASDPQWEIEPPMSGSIFDQDATDVPSASTEIATETAANPFEMATEVEQTLGELDTTGLFSMDEETPMAIAGVDSSLAETDTFDVLTTNVDADPNLYTSDDELPLPDFTGVYDDEGAESSSGSVESTISSSLSVGRHELDSLRPEEDPEDSVLVADVQEKRDLSGIVQFSFVVFIGIAALVMYWVLDPTALADMRANLDNLLGR